MPKTKPLPIVTAKNARSDSLRSALDENKGQPFIFVDANRDVPEDFAGKVSREFAKTNKDFLVSSNGHLSGVYGPDAHWLIPRSLNGTSPLAWARQHLGALIAETDLFDSLPARPRTVAGHVYFHSGDLGDVIAALPVIRHLGGGHLILGNRHGRAGRELMTRNRYDAIAPLLEAQPYIASVSHCDDAPDQQRDVASMIGSAEEEVKVTHDFTRFREKPPPPDYNLATWQSNYFDCENIDLSPWLTATPSEESKGKAIFARSQRFHNPQFNWGHIVASFPEALFVGLQEEWDEWRNEMAGNRVNIYKVSYRPTSTLLEVAELITGSEIFISNQSCPFWIAAALGHRLIQETDIYNLNSIVARDNALFCQGKYPLA